METPLFQNPWFVGIVGGILSGVAATWISRLIFSRRDSREYAQKVAAVNREVIYSVRPGISEGNIPGPAVLRSLVSATCRKYGVAESDAYNVQEISEELMKEVMDSSFISSAIKQDYCTKLLQMPEPEPAPVAAAAEIAAKEASVSSIESVRSRLLAQMSAVVGVMVAALTMFLTLFKQRFDLGDTSSLRELSSLPLVVLAVSVLSMVAVLLATIVLREARRSVRKERDSEGGSKEEKNG